jgi:PAS domain S-box-containing protein
LCLVLAGLGLWAGELRARAVDGRLREALLQEAAEIAQTIDPDLARALTFSPADAGTPADVRLRAHLATYTELVRWGGIYTLALRDGKLVFGPESYPPDSALASPPGTVYQEPGADDFRVITEARAYVVGPEWDEYGVFVSALAPVQDPRTGEALFAIGIDILADDWQARVNAARVRPLLFAGVAMLLVVAGAYAFERRMRQPDAAPPCLRHLEVAVIVAWSLYVTAIATLLVAEAEIAERDHLFQMLAEAQTERVRAEMEQVRSDLGALARFYESSEHVDSWEFAAFARPMIRSRVAQTYGWAPSLAPDEAAAWLADAQLDWQEGLSLWELGPDGERRPVSERAGYHPVAYVEPPSASQALLGYDLGSEPWLADSLEEATLADLQTAASPVHLTQAGGQWGLWVLRPVGPSPEDEWPVRQEGHVLAVLPLQSLLNASLRAGHDDPGFVGMDLVHLEDAHRYTMLASHPHSDDGTYLGPDGHNTLAGQRLEHVVPLFVFGRTLALAYYPTPAFYASQPLRTAPVVGAAGLAVTLSLATLAAWMRRQAYRLERLVGERTAALAESESHYRALYDQALNPIMVADGEGRYLDANHAALAFLDCSREELAGRSVWSFAPSEELARLHAEHAPDETPLTIEAPHVVGGRIKTLLLNIVPVSQGGRTVLFGIGQDITERKEAEQRRLEMERQLLQAQKLESLGVLAGGIAHDFNNLLAAILGNLELALMELPPGSQVHESLHEAMSASRRAADLTRQMLAYSGKGRFLLSDLDLSALVQENAHMLRVALPRSATLQLDLAHNLPRIRADAGQIQQVVMNLIINAAEALERAAGVVSLATGQEEYGAEALGHSRTAEKPAPGRYVWLSVTDTGCGMSAETLQRMFDPFFTSKETGRGLGTSAVLGIVHGHKGAIWVESTPGRGTTVRVAFPMLPPEKASAPAAARATNARLSGVILVVDDEEMVRNLCCTVLERMGLTAIPAADGEEACALYAARAGEIDGVLLDLTMPGMDGADTLEELRRIDPGVKALLCSGFGEQAVSERLAGVGFTGFVQKPFDVQTLRDALERLLDGS